ncbi:MAG: alpha/beta fold hydrolase, partial [Gammaproteobacteria bacterium]|nr:alpha/beta fold hydrolase [Gammaproteobacteria bacterium]
AYFLIVDYCSVTNDQQDTPPILFVHTPDLTITQHGFNSIKIEKRNQDLEDHIYAALYVHQLDLRTQIMSGISDEQRKNINELVLLSLESRFKITFGEARTKLLGSLDNESLKTGIFAFWRAKLIDGDIPVKIKQIIDQTVDKSRVDFQPLASYSTEPIKYGFENRLKYALRQYQDLHPDGVITAHRVKDIEELKKLNSRKAVEDYFKTANFQTGISSRLKKLVLSAIARPESERTLQLKTWKGTSLKGEKKKVVLAIHGLGDSVETFNRKAEELVAQGYEVISYDQAGHGFDELRGKTGLDLQQMQHDFYAMLDKQLDDKEVGELVILGHSLGAAMIANSYKSINDEGSPSSKTVKVELFAPAAMENPTLELLGNGYNVLTDPSGMSERNKYEREQGISRIGGVKFSVFTLGDFITFMANAFKSLRHFATKSEVKLHIVADQDDPIVSSANARQLQEQKRENVNVTVDIVKSYAGHHPHFADLKVDDTQSQSSERSSSPLK